MRPLLAVLLLCLLASPAVGQTLWAPPYTPNQVVVEGVRSELPEASSSILSGATFFTGTHSFTDHVEVAAEVPIARHTASDAPTSTALGNPYLGLGLSSTTIPILLELGVRIPVAPASTALHAGRAADVGRTPAFARDAFSVSALANGRLPLGRTTSLRLRAGPTYVPSPRDTTGQTDRRNWLLHYSAQLWREGDALLLGLSLTGRVLLTAPGSYRNSRHVLVGSFMANGTRFQPGLLMGLSRQEDADDVHLLVGLTLAFSYGS